MNVRNNNDHHIEQSMDQPGKVANSARGQLNRENDYSPYVRENLVSRDGFSRPAPRQPAHLHILRLNLLLTHGIPPDFRDGIYLFI